MTSMKITIRAASWHNDRASLSFIRETVFIKEQEVPRALEWDGEDLEAYHWLAEDEQHRPVGCVRMLNDGHIGRMAVLKAFRHSGCGKNLLKAAVLFAEQKLKLYEVYLAAQIQAAKFYRRYKFRLEGEVFIDAAIPHIKMRRRVSPQRLLGTHAGKFHINDHEKAALAIIKQTKRRLRILNYNLDHEVFDHERLCDAISSLARSHRYSEIKILLIDVKPIVQRGHKLLKLQRKLPSSIVIRQIEPEHTLKENLIIADTCGVIAQSHYNNDNMWGDFNNNPSTQSKIDLFEHYWSQSFESSDLKLLEI